MSITRLFGDCRAVMATLPERSVHCVITSPPYYGLRTYGDDPREIGREATPDAYISSLVDAFRGVRRVLRDDGVMLLNLGDSYNAAGRTGHGTRIGRKQQTNRASATGADHIRATDPFAKPKDKLLIPHRVALALQDDGWYVRADMPWVKRNPMPESVRDRPGVAHEYLFLLAKQERYFWDVDATRVAPVAPGGGDAVGRNLRTVDLWMLSLDAQIAWHQECLDALAQVRARGGMLAADGDPVALQVNVRPYHGAHFAVFPPTLIDPLMRAACPERVCASCGAPWTRRTTRERPSPTSRRPQARRAAELWTEHGLTDDHLSAIRAVGMADAGKARQTMTGAGANRPEVQRLADEAKAALGGYLREFLFGPSVLGGSTPSCTCASVDPVPGTVLDPFSGSGTVGEVASRRGRQAILIDLNTDYDALQEQRITHA